MEVKRIICSLMILLLFMPRREALYHDVLPNSRGASEYSRVEENALLAFVFARLISMTPITKFISVSSPRTGDALPECTSAGQCFPSSPCETVHTFAIIITF